MKQREARLTFEAWAVEDAHWRYVHGLEGVDDLDARLGAIYAEIERWSLNGTDLRTRREWRSARGHFDPRPFRETLTRRLA